VEWWGVARALHVVGVVLWIGGVAMVTLVLIPAVRRMGSDPKAVGVRRRFCLGGV
jgi:uncharacterized membrane protein